MSIVGWFIGIGILLLVTRRTRGFGGLSPWAGLKSKLAAMNASSINATAAGSALGLLLLGFADFSSEDGGIGMFRLVAAVCGWVFIAVCLDGMRRANLQTFGSGGFEGMLRQQAEQSGKTATRPLQGTPARDIPAYPAPDAVSLGAPAEDLAAWASRLASRYTERAAAPTHPPEAEALLSADDDPPLDTNAIARIVSDALHLPGIPAENAEYYEDEPVAELPDGSDETIPDIAAAAASPAEEPHVAVEDSAQQPAAPATRPYGEATSIFVSAPEDRPWDRGSGPVSGLSRPWDAVGGPRQGLVRPAGPVTLGGSPAGSPASHSEAVAPSQSQPAAAVAQAPVSLFSYKPQMVVSRLAGPDSDEKKAD